MHLIKKRKRLIAFLRKCQIDEHTAVIFALQLVKCDLHLCVGILKHLHQIIIQCDIPFIHFIVEEHEHINQGYAVV